MPFLPLFLVSQKKRVQDLFPSAKNTIPIPARTTRGRSPLWVGVGVAEGVRVAEIWAVWPAVTCWVACQS